MEYTKLNLNAWLAGIMDGDGNFDLRRNPNTKELVPLLLQGQKLKQIRIKYILEIFKYLTRLKTSCNVVE